MARSVGWFSAGAASAIAMMLSQPNVIAYCDTGSEDIDNHRFRADIERHLGRRFTVLKSAKYESTWDVWEARQYIAGINGAPCTGELKRVVREAYQRPDDIHIFGYTADPRDVIRAVALRENWPDLDIRTPLIDAGLSKKACLSMLVNLGIQPPRVYAMGYPNANCIPCCKATSPAYWALVRKCHPVEFQRFSDLSRRLDCRAARLNGERVFVDEIPLDHPIAEPLAPECDFLCQLAESDLGDAAQAKQEALS